MKNLVCINNNKVNYICFAIISKICNENNGKFGIAHLMEHLAFRKADKFGQDEIYNISESLGVNLNATTYKNCIRFDFVCRTENFSKIIDLLAKMFYELDYDNAMLEAEKKVVCSEIKQRYYSYADDIINSLWCDSRLRHHILGYEETIDEITLPDIKNYKKDFIENSKHCIFLMGNYNESDVNLVERLFGDILCKNNILSPQMVLVNSDERKLNFIRKKSDTVLIYYAFHFNLSQEDKFYSRARVKMLDEILFKGNTAYLKEKLRENKGYVYEFESYIENLENEMIYLFGFEVEYDYMRDAVKILENEMDLFTINDKFIRYVKAFYCDNYDINFDSFINVFYEYIDNYINLEQVISPKELCRKISETKEEELNLFFKDMVKKKNIFIIGNLRKKDKEYLMKEVKF